MRALVAKAHQRRAVAGYDQPMHRTRAAQLELQREQPPYPVLLREGACMDHRGTVWRHLPLFAQARASLPGGERLDVDPWTPGCHVGGIREATERLVRARRRHQDFVADLGQRPEIPPPQRGCRQRVEVERTDERQVQLRGEKQREKRDVSARSDMDELDTLALQTRD